MMKSIMLDEKLPREDMNDKDTLVQNAEVLQKGIWPRSSTLWMAAFYMALFIIRPWELLFPSTAFLHPERVYAVCMIVAVFLSREKHFQMTWQTMTVLLFFAALAFSAIFAVNTSLAWDPLYQYLSIVIFYFIILLVIRSPYDLAFMVLCYVAIMCVYLGKSLWEFFLNGRHQYAMGVVRMVGIESTFGGPNNLAMSIVISLPFAVFLWRNRTVITETWPAALQKRFMWGLRLYGVLAVTSIILTNSRSGMLGFLLFVAMLVFGGNGFGRRLRHIITVFLVFCVIWFFMPAENKGRLQTIWAPEEGPTNAQVSAEGRIAGYKAGMEMFRRYPFTGVGIGNFLPYRVENVDGVYLEPHNLEGQLLGETGLLGGLTFLLMVGAVLGNCHKINRFALDQTGGMPLFLVDLSKACRRSLLLLIFLGTFGHNLYRFNWLWLAAFSILGLQFARTYAREEC